MSSRRLQAQGPAPAQETAPHELPSQQRAPTGVSTTHPSSQQERYSPYSPRVGEMWRTGRAVSHSYGWFRPSQPAH